MNQIGDRTFYSIEKGDKYIIRVKNLWKNSVSFEYGQSLLLQYVFSQDQALNDIQEIAILGSTLQAYHTAILLKNQGFQVRVYEQESDHLNQVWLPLKIGAMSQKEQELYDVVAKCTYDTYNHLISRNQYFGLKKIKLAIEGTETEIQNFQKNNFPISIKSINDVILIEKQFYNELRHECHSIGVHFSKFISEKEIPNKHIINCIVEEEKMKTIQQKLPLTLYLPECIVGIPQLNGTSIIGDINSLKQKIQNPKL